VKTSLLLENKQSQPAYWRQPPPRAFTQRPPSRSRRPPKAASLLAPADSRGRSDLHCGRSTVVFQATKRPRPLTGNENAPFQGQHKPSKCDTTLVNHEEGWGETSGTQPVEVSRVAARLPPFWDERENKILLCNLSGRCELDLRYFIQWQAFVTSVFWLP
jgi:hypothetical protein